MGPSSLSTGKLSVNAVSGFGAIRFRGRPLQPVSCYTLPSGCQPSWPPPGYHQQATPFEVSEDEPEIGHRNPGSRSIPHRQYSLPVMAHTELGRNSQHQTEGGGRTTQGRLPRKPPRSAYDRTSTLNWGRQWGHSAEAAGMVRSFLSRMGGPAVRPPNEGEAGAAPLRATEASAYCQFGV